MVPCTLPGKALTMLFATTGVPLALFCLARLGRPIKLFFEQIWFGCSPRQDPNGEERSLPLPVGIILTLVRRLSLLGLGESSFNVN